MANKMTQFILISACAMLILITGCAQKKQQVSAVQLFNGTDLSGWHIVLADSQYAENDVFFVKDSVLHCTGATNGYIRTDNDCANYTLTVDWRWIGEPGNSGVFVHAQPPDKVWPQTIECQLMAGHAGDFVLIGPNSIKIDTTMYETTHKSKGIGKMHESSEKPAGEWNHYKIVCKDDSITCYVNGVLQNSGGIASITSGKICLQSEGTPIEFRNITMTTLEK
ncbi:DUF1080 domain-containing protein [candidate division KSB1 bacterium]|nr:DUF1080 domain-containing protein [candidate division KSB1 bacterium]